MPSTRTSQNCLPGTRMNNLDYGTVSSKVCLERFVEVGASRRRRLPGAGPMDVNELGIAREQPFERDVVDYGRARPIAFGLRECGCSRRLRAVGWFQRYLCGVAYLPIHHGLHVLYLRLL